MALLFLFVTNIVFFVLMTQKCGFKEDPLFIEWQKKKKRSHCCIRYWGLFTSFQVGRLYYSRLFGFKSFSAKFTKFSKYLKIINALSLANLFLTLMPIIIIDVWALSQYKWGTQFYVILIETLVLSLIMAFLTCMEFRIGGKRDKDKLKTKDEEENPKDYAKLNEFSEVLDKTFHRHRDWLENHSQQPLS